MFRLFGDVAEKPDPEQGPIPASVKMVAMALQKVIDPTALGSGKLQWHELGQHAVTTISRMRMMVRHRQYTELHEAAPQYTLIEKCCLESASDVNKSVLCSNRAY